VIYDRGSTGCTIACAFSVSAVWDLLQVSRCFRHGGVGYLSPFVIEDVHGQD
jgi:hypothetical protein